MVPVNDDEINKDLLHMANGIDIPCDLEVPRNPPPWLDKELFHLGQQFFWGNCYPVLVCSMRSLLIGISLPNLCVPLVLTRRSETKEKARSRYIETGYHIGKWYRMTPWDTERCVEESTMSIEIVNKYHQEAAKLCRKYSREERLDKVASILDKSPPTTKDVRRKTHLDSILFKNLSDIKNSRFKDNKFELYNRYISSEVAFSQMDMALVQAAFFASFTAFPDHFGAQHASDEELCAFVHVWRVIGYYLGLEDQYNLARLETIEETRSLLISLGNEYVIPAFLHLDSISLRMLKSFSEGFNIDYHIAMYRHAYAHGYELKLLWSHFSFKQKCLYYLSKTIDYVYCNIPIIKRFINNMYKKHSDKFHEQRASQMASKFRDTQTANPMTKLL